ncbi:MAG: hypothetical protein KU37_10370 [Sulfuricurvum sp. PC08-66]|nr:MAG: hypothetical protein KU37_10370 [Sulfuricurvum sp. PC08-66]
MKRSLLLLFLLLAPSLYADRYKNDTNSSNVFTALVDSFATPTPSKWSLGFGAGNYGTGLTARLYNGDTFWQVAGFLAYTQNENSYYSYYSTPVDNSFSLSKLKGSFGIAFGGYLVRAIKPEWYLLPQALTLKGGMHASHDTYTEVATSIGIGFEFFNPQIRGFFYELSIDYAIIASTYNFYIGPSASVQIGFNF